VIRVNNVSFLFSLLRNASSLSTFRAKLSLSATFTVQRTGQLQLDTHIQTDGSSEWQLGEATYVKGLFWTTGTRVHFFICLKASNVNKSHDHRQ